MMSRYILPEVFLLLYVGFSCADLHSHFFYWTVTNDPTMGIPSYTMTRTLDDVTLFQYDSDNEVVERKVPWFKTPNRTLLDSSLIYHSQQQNMQNVLLDILYDLNVTGYHILQGLQGCTLYDNGTVQASFTYGYDGEPLMSLNMENVSWTAEIPEIEEHVQNSNSKKKELEADRRFLMNDCIAHMNELLALGNNTFNRKEPPVIKVTYIPIDDVGLRFYCRAYGHYPKDIFIMWSKNGQQISEEILERVTLPIPGLTYLTSVSLNVSSMADDVYTCTVSHSSMPQDFTQDIRISHDFTNISTAASYPFLGGVIAICLAVILVLVLATLGAVSVLKRQ